MSPHQQTWTTITRSIPRTNPVEKSPLKTGTPASLADAGVSCRLIRMEQLEVMYLATGDTIAPLAGETLRPDSEKAIVLDAYTKWTPYGLTTTITYKYRAAASETTIHFMSTVKVWTERHSINKPEK